MRGSGAVRAGAPPAFGRCCAKPVHPGAESAPENRGRCASHRGRRQCAGYRLGQRHCAGYRMEQRQCAVCRVGKQQKRLPVRETTKHRLRAWLGNDAFFDWLRWIRVSEGPGGPYPERSHTRDKIFDPTFGAVRRNADNGERTYKQRQGLQAERRWPPSRRSGTALGEKRG